MHGGELIGNGNNTCVYNPPIECVDNSEIPAGHVSRIVPSDSIEPAVQAKIQAALKNMNPKYLKHFNLATKICKANFKQTDLVKQCTVATLSDKVKVGNTDLINMLTPIQESDINKKNGKLYKNVETTTAGLKDFLHALVEMNSYSVQVFHTDAHLGNFSWKGDSVVLHDWEKCSIGDNNLLEQTNGSGPKSWEIFGYIQTGSERMYLSRFPCWHLIIRAINGSFDRYMGHFPYLNPGIMHVTHEILFRFWDLFSIAPSLSMVYINAEIAKPKIIDIIIDNALMYFIDLFHDEYEMAMAKMAMASKPADLDDKKTKLDKITNRLHAIIDTASNAAVPPDEKTAVDAELLKLVAKYANSSPSKQVLQNMLPKVPNS